MMLYNTTATITITISIIIIIATTINIAAPTNVMVVMSCVC